MNKKKTEKKAKNRFVIDSRGNVEPRHNEIREGREKRKKQGEILLKFCKTETIKRFAKRLFQWYRVHVNQ